MLGVSFALFVSMVIPFVMLGIAIFLKQTFPFILGGIAFSLTQLIFHFSLFVGWSSPNTTNMLFDSLHPASETLLIGVLAVLTIEGTRFIIMRWGLKRKDWWAGFSFGAGYGGFGAVVIVGFPAFIMATNPTTSYVENIYAAAGLEQIFAIMLHIGLSVLILQSIIHKKWRFIIAAVIIHGLTEAIVSFLPLILSRDFQLVIIHFVLFSSGIVMLIYALYVKRKGEVE